MGVFLYHALLRVALIWAGVGLIVTAIALALLFDNLGLTLIEYLNWVIGMSIVAGALGAFYERFRFRE